MGSLEPSPFLAHAAAERRAADGDNDDPAGDAGPPTVVENGIARSGGRDGFGGFGRSFITDSVGRGQTNDPEDVFRVSTLLAENGFLGDATRDPSEDFLRGVEAGQSKLNDLTQGGLRVDGVVRPEGPTEIIAQRAVTGGALRAPSPAVATAKPENDQGSSPTTLTAAAAASTPGQSPGQQAATVRKMKDGQARAETRSRAARASSETPPPRPQGPSGLNLLAPAPTRVHGQNIGKLLKSIKAKASQGQPAPSPGDPAAKPATTRVELPAPHTKVRDPGQVTAKPNARPTLPTPHRSIDGKPEDSRARSTSKPQAPKKPPGAERGNTLRRLATLRELLARRRVDMDIPVDPEGKPDDVKAVNRRTVIIDGMIGILDNLLAVGSLFRAPTIVTPTVKDPLRQEDKS